MGQSIAKDMGDKPRVLVALSGGVDSSVAALMLKEQGYDVSGAFIVTWSAPWLPCTWKEERLHAMRVAAELGIPFHTVDLSKEYEEQVVTYMVREYAAGRTPNPDVMCNKHVKFGAFLQWAKDHGYDAIATGHYAQTNKNAELLCAVDTEKDQTYFLWTLTAEQLTRTLFPVGALHKRDVRARAQQAGLHTATKKDSQGVCFLGKLDMKEFLTHYLTTEPGDVLNTDGVPIGTHNGALFYTLGERHGFTITKKTPHDTPVYVVAKDMVQNTITVGSDIESMSYSTERITLENTNWIKPLPVSDNRTLQCVARLRYRQPLFPVELTIEDDGTRTVVLQTPQPYVQPGQSVVLYQDERCIGGGVIARTE